MFRSPQFPALPRYFKTVTELANAACCSRSRATDCLHGRKEFTPQEKQALMNAITLKQKKITVDYDFDDHFRRYSA